MRWPFGPPHLTLKPSKKTKEKSNNPNTQTWFSKQQQEEAKPEQNRKKEKAKRRKKGVQHQECSSPKACRKEWLLKHQLVALKQSFLDLCNSNMPNYCFLLSPPRIKIGFEQPLVLRLCLKKT